ncbi:MAG: hypothetical protein IPG50_37405 [Myxococcales bacterium]|nr:hypothetical protein [Myxococcales bacterium]
MMNTTTRNGLGNIVRNIVRNIGWAWLLTGAALTACAEDEALSGPRPPARASAEGDAGAPVAKGAPTVGPDASAAVTSPFMPEPEAGAPVAEASAPSVAGRFVAVGYDGRRAMSLDGRTWTGDTREGNGNVDGPELFRDVAFANGLFVAVGGGCAGGCKGRITVTSDGLTWKDVAPAAADNWLGGVAYGNGTWVTVGGFARVLRSVDAITWTPTDVADGSLRGMRFESGWFVAVGDGGRRRRSQDGLTWVDATMGGGGLHSLAYGNGVWVAAGYGGRRVRSTDNGATWSNDVTSDNTESVTFAEGRFLATSQGGPVLTSTDGASWTSHGGSGASGIAFGRPGGQPRYVGFAWVSTRRASDDGLAWRDAVGDDGTSAFGSVAYGP